MNPVTVETADGVTLGGAVHEPDGPPRAALLIAGGTGIPARFYGRFAAHAAGRGLAALTFDYRGVGASAPPSLRGSEIRYRHWGQRDIPAAIDWLGERYPDVPVVYVGHSAGGQQLGLAPNVGRLRAAVLVAVSTGYWRGMPTAYKWLTLAIWKGYLPLASRLVGYAPAKAIGWGENLPSGVAREWAAWSLRPEYMAAFFDGAGRPTTDGDRFGPVHFDDAAFPVRAYTPTDDPIATRANVPPMLALYDRAEIETRWIEPADLGVAEVGHLGFFRSDVGAPLWDDACDFLLSTAAAPDPGGAVPSASR